MKYQELKKKHENRINKFDALFFAFSNEQLKEGMEKLNLTPDQTNKIYSIGAGGYILKTRSKEFNNIFETNSKELEEAMLNKDFLIDAFNYELSNHEFCYTYEIDEALSVFGLNENELTELQKEAMKEAIKLQYKWMNENDY